MTVSDTPVRDIAYAYTTLIHTRQNRKTKEKEAFFFSVFPPTLRRASHKVKGVVGSSSDVSIGVSDCGGMGAERSSAMSSLSVCKETSARQEELSLLLLLLL
mmetsp:Transcript_38795/g.99581  ORF Transcript_38795/g.99581 Transcript_38795/m.99581 type:complete len:102 (+) Transcript_38795:638-943(+)